MFQLPNGSSRASAVPMRAHFVYILCQGIRTLAYSQFRYHGILSPSSWPEILEASDHLFQARLRWSKDPHIGRVSHPTQDTKAVPANRSKRWNARYPRAGSLEGSGTGAWGKNTDPSLFRSYCWDKVRYVSERFCAEGLTCHLSTGGLIALGLGVKQWSVDQCIAEFVRLVDQAFSPREFNNITVLEEAATVSHGSKYKTQPLRRALLSSFGKEQLYGGQKAAHRVYNTHVAVTAASGTGEEAIVLANYSRHDENEPRYRFEFPHHLRIWEAASATSAAPSFFKPFTSSIGRTYLDGAVYYNNPVKVANHERKILWPDVAENPPDIILSLGTGQNGRQIQEKTQGISSNSNIRQTTPGIYKRPLQKYFRKTKEKLGEVRPSRFLPEMLKVLVCKCPPGS